MEISIVGIFKLLPSTIMLYFKFITRHQKLSEIQKKKSQSNYHIESAIAAFSSYNFPSI